MKRIGIHLFLIGVVSLLCWSLVPPVAAQELHATTSSPEALKHFEQGRHEMEKFNADAARAEWHKAIELDADFTMAHVFLAFVPSNPAEQQSELRKAISTKGHASAGEQVVVNWLESAVQGKTLVAIQSLNDAIALYPGDKSFNWGAGLWLEYRGACDRAIPIFEHVLQQDRHFAPAWRDLGNCYTKAGAWSKGLSAMKEYVALLPRQAAPEIFYGETLAQAGKYDKAVSHCRAALAIDSHATEAWYCLAQVDALKGDEKRARTEYTRFAESGGPGQRTWAGALELAVTYVREGDYRGADQAFSEVVNRAHHASLGTTEAEAYRSMALYSEDRAAVQDLLKKADAALQEHPSDAMARASENAKIEQTRVMLALHFQDMPAAESALKRLQGLNANHLPLVEQCYSGAEGALLLTQGKYGEAATYLTADSGNAFSLQNLITAYQKSGSRKRAREAQQMLEENHSASLEQALVNQDLHKHKVQMASN